MSNEIADARILIVDDTLKNIQVLGTILKKEGYQINVAQNGLQALATVEKTKPDLILLDVMMPEMDGFETCQKLKENPHNAEIPVIFLTAKVESEDIVKGFELGAVDYVTKPFNATELLVRVKSHLTLRILQKKSEQQNKALAHELRVVQELFEEANNRLDGTLFGESEIIRKTRDEVLLHAKESYPVLLQGERGAGDEAIARAIHSVSPRAKHAFIHVNCLNIKKDQEFYIFNEATTNVDSETSKYALAYKGTLYLYGIHALSLSLQQQLLDNIRKYEHPPVRLIAYTWINLQQKILDKTFSAELYEVLHINILQVPLLQERREDIPILVSYFIQQCARRLGKSIDIVPPTAMTLLSQYSWPGNIRELRNIIERLVFVSKGNVLDVNEDFLNVGMKVDRYRLIQRLGKGGMGEVWQAKHQFLARPAAVKIINTEIIADENKKEKALKRFRKEAETIARLTSPHTVSIYDYGVTESGTLYYVMELLHGMDLGEIITRFGALPPERATIFLQQICRSLGEAHETGIIHRDIKSPNLFICKLGIEYDFLKVLDFGIVKYLEEKKDPANAKEFMGSPMYTAPELISDYQSGDMRADIYSLGCVAYRMITGKFLFEAKSIQQLFLHHIKTTPTKLSEMTTTPIPEELENTILACVEKKPENRPQTVQEVWESLAKITFANPWTQERAESWWQQKIPNNSLLSEQETKEYLDNLE